MKTANTEIWKPIPEFPEYSVSSLGRLLSFKSGEPKLMRTSPNHNGYPQAILYRNGRQHHQLVHRLTATAFIPNPENKPEVNHKNGDKEDGSVSNLEWATDSENKQHSCYVLGNRTKTFRLTSPTGGRAYHHRAESFR